MYIYIYMYIYMYIYIHMYIYTYIYACITLHYIPLHLRIYINIYVHKYVGIYMCIYIWRERERLQIVLWASNRSNPSFQGKPRPRCGQSSCRACDAQGLPCMLLGGGRLTFLWRWRTKWRTWIL